MLAQEQNGDNRTGANGRKDRSIAIMQSEQQGKELRGKKDLALGTRGILTKGLTLTHWSPRRKEV